MSWSLSSIIAEHCMPTEPGETSCAHCIRAPRLDALLAEEGLRGETLYGRGSSCSTNGPQLGQRKRSDIGNRPPNPHGWQCFHKGGSVISVDQA